MSTLGGSKGERNAKPKFSALDINRLHKSSRGESVEPSAQKNQVPRKHGMQSLGKVPSARRPPANLPSLKAEVKAPGNQIKIGQDGIVQGTGTGTNSGQTLGSSAQGATANSKTIINSTNNSNSHLQNSSSSNERHTSAAHPSSLNSSSSSVTWSSVTTGQDGRGDSVPPLYQSPQFQHEFPSLDGSIPGSVKSSSNQHPKDVAYQQQSGNAGSGNQSGSGDMQQVSLRPQTDAASWIQHQQGGKAGNDFGGGNQQAPAHHQTVPPPLRALMPPFMYRGSGTGQQEQSARSLTPPTIGGGQNGNFTSSQGKPLQRPQDSKDYRSLSPNGNHRGIVNATGIQKRPSSMHTPPLSGGVRGGSRDRESIPYIEPEVALLQRPIIREEELERMNAIAKEDGWAQQDEIDYNQKLALSDDESPENSPSCERDRPPIFNKSDKKGGSRQLQHHKQEQEERNAWQRDRDRDKERKEREHIEKERNDRNDRERNRDPESRQNGRSGGLDAGIVERAKQRKEEEEKRELERKQAANKKLQELEMKMNKKSNETDSSHDHEESRGKDDDYHTSQVRRPYKDNNRDFGRYEKFDRDQPHPRDREQNFSKDSYGSGNQSRAGGASSIAPSKTVFSAHFQSNLPPRFLRQQQAASGQQTGGVSGGSNSSISAPNDNSNSRTNTANQQSHNYHHAGGGPAAPRDKPNVPFAQQYDPRYIHSQNYKQQQQNQMRRNDDSMRRDRDRERDNNYGGRGPMNRARNDNSENDDDRYNNNRGGNRDRDSHHEVFRSSNQLSRSISDSSQRKTSVSSNDEQKFGEHQRNDSREMDIVTSWAEETDAEMRRQREESFSSSHSKNDDEIQVKQILQRPKNVSECSSKNEKLNLKDESSGEQKGTPTQILRRSESPKPSSDSSFQQESSKMDSSQDSVKSAGKHNTPDDGKRSEKSPSVSNECEKVSDDEKKDEKDKLKSASSEERGDDGLSKSHQDSKQIRRSPRGGSSSGHSGGGRHDVRGHGQSSRSYGSYRGSSGGSSWSRRGGNVRSSGGRYYNDWSESENSEDIADDDYKRSDRGGPKGQRKDQFGGSGNVRDRDQRDRQSNKEGFAPRGEPSRRGRGGSISTGSSSFRRGGGISNSGPRRDNYGQSKSSFSSEESKDKRDKVADDTTSDDKTKQSQIALNAGLKKCETIDSEKNKNKPTGLQDTKREEKKGSTPPRSSGGYQNSRKESTSSSKNEDDNRKDDKDNDRGKLPSKDKDISSTGGNQTSRSNSSGHITSNARSSSNVSGQANHAKKDDRSSQKSSSLTKPPPGLGFKQSSNLSQSSTQSIQSNKDQGLQKSKSSSDARTERSSNSSGGTSSKNAPPRLNKQWDNNVRRDQRRDDGGNWDKNQADKSETSDLKEVNQQTVLSDSKAAGQIKSDKTVLDGSSPPVNTIIFENKNYKTSVQTPNQQLKRQGPSLSEQFSQGGSQPQVQKKLDEVSNNKVQQGATSAHQDMSSNQQQQQPQSQQIQQQHHQPEAISTALSQMSFNKQSTESADYDKDMKIGFGFDTEFPHLTEQEKNSQSAGNVNAPTTKPSMGAPRSTGVIQHPTTTGGQNTISPSTADLNMKIASVKKVWESVSPMPTVLENVGMHANENDSHLASNYVTSQQHQQHLQQFVAAHAAHGNIHMQHALSSPGPPSYTNSFDPSLEQQFGPKDPCAGNVVVTSNQNDMEGQVGYSPSPQHSGPNVQGVPQGGSSSNLALKHAADVLASSNKQVKSAQQQMHPSGLGLSPPPMQQQSQQQQQQNQAQIHQVATAAAGPQTFYQPSQFTGIPTIPSPPAVVFNSSAMPSQAGIYPFQIEAGRSQFPQFPTHYGATGSGPYSAYTMQTPPNMQAAQAPDMYQSLTSQFRMGGAVQSPFNQNQQLNNPNAVLIPSSSNSLMSASVKQSSQQIGAIGSKNNAAAVAAASVGQPYGQQYMGLYQPQQAPPQLTSNSYYSNSAGGQGAYYGGPSAPGATQSYGIQTAGIFGGHGGPNPSNGPPQQQMANFNSQFMNSPILTAAAMNQFRGGPNPQTQTYMKANQGPNHMQDSMGRQLKSPLGADVSLNLSKQVQPQQSPPHHKNFAPWDMNQVMQQQQSQQQPQQNNRGGPQNNVNPNMRPGQGPQRYPTPIQRPTNYPQHPQQSMLPPQSQRPLRQSHSGQQGSGGPMNKHYYSNNNAGGNRGQHSNNQSEQNKTSNIEKDSASLQQEMSVKEDNSNG